MIFLAVAGPTPFRLSSSSGLAVLRSTGPRSLAGDAWSGALALVVPPVAVPTAGPVVTRGVTFAIVALGTPAPSSALATSAPAG